MRFLSSPTEISAVLEQRIRRCTSLRWAVAWASRSASPVSLLEAHAEKIRQLTVGTHFYQTDPEFIAAFLEHPNVQFVMDPSGVFHPKLYFFEHDGGEWECVVGSANLTVGALTTNAEAAVHFTHRDAGADEALSKVRASLDAYRATARSVGAEDLAAYRAMWSRQQRRIGPLSGTYESGQTTPRRRRSPPAPLDIPLFREGWREYFDSLRKHEKHSTEGRLAVLEGAQRLFANHRSFRRMSETQRKGIAGLIHGEDVDWLWFGSMKGAGFFRQAVSENATAISAALDCIPLRGEIGEDSYAQFASLYRTAFERAGLATASRLLAMKRPDYFVCLDSKNKRNLCDAFGISQNVDFDNYWERVVVRLTDANWWNAPEPGREIERRVWRCRAAFLDARFYDPS